MINWKQLEFTDYLINSKTETKYFQQYLKPCYYLEIFFRWSNTNELLDLYESVAQLMGHLFKYHKSDSSEKETKIKNSDKALSIFRAFLQSEEAYCSRYLSNVGGVGSSTEMGGVGDASFSCWMHKAPYSESLRDKQTCNLRDIALDYGIEMVLRGIPISHFQICFPLNLFKNNDDFLSHVINDILAKIGMFFSGSAGYRVNEWRGAYTNQLADEKLKDILINYPGLDWNIPIGNSMGRVLNSDKSDIIPIIKRVNWLTLVSDEGLPYLGGKEEFLRNIRKNKNCIIHQLNNGIGIQANSQPVISKLDDKIDTYLYVNKVLNPLLYRKHEKDFFSKVAEDWLYWNL